MKRYKCPQCKEHYMDTVENRSKQSMRGAKHCGSIDCMAKAAMKLISLKKKAEKRRWKGRKAKLEKAVGVKKIGNADSLQRAVNSISKILDNDKPCFVFPDKQNAHWNAGHVISRGANPSIKYLLLNIHKESVASNSDQSISNEFKLKMLCERYNSDVRDSIEWIVRENQILNLSEAEKKAKATEARKIIKELRAGKEYTRREIDARLGIYKLPSIDLYYI